MKKLVLFLMIIILTGCTSKVPEAVHDMEEIEKNSIILSAKNYINQVELNMIYSDSKNKTITDNSIEISGLKPSEVMLIIENSIVVNGYLKYDFYVVEINNKKLEFKKIDGE